MAGYMLSNGMPHKCKVIAHVGERYFYGRLAAVTEEGDFIVEKPNGTALLIRKEIGDIVRIEEDDE